MSYQVHGAGIVTYVLSTLFLVGNGIIFVLHSSPFHTLEKGNIRPDRKCQGAGADSGVTP